MRIYVGGRGKIRYNYVGRNYHFSLADVERPIIRVREGAQVRDRSRNPEESAASCVRRRRLDIHYCDSYSYFMGHGMPLNAFTAVLDFILAPDTVLVASFFRRG